MPSNRTQVDRLHDVTTLLLVGAFVAGICDALILFHVWSQFRIAKKLGVQPHISAVDAHWFLGLLLTTVMLGFFARVTARRMSYITDTLATMNVMRGYVTGSRRRRWRMAVRHNRTKARKGG